MAIANTLVMNTSDRKARRAVIRMVRSLLGGSGRPCRVLGMVTLDRLCSLISCGQVAHMRSTLQDAGGSRACGRTRC